MLPVFEHGTRLLPVQRVPHRRFDGLVMGRERAVEKSGRVEEPAHAVGLQDEGTPTREAVQADAIGFCGCVGPLGEREVRNVVSYPLSLGLVPPDPLLPLAPGPPGRIRGGAVVQHPAVRRPGPAPGQMSSLDLGRVGDPGRRSSEGRERPADHVLSDLRAPYQTSRPRIATAGMSRR